MSGTGHGAVAEDASSGAGASMSSTGGNDFSCCNETGRRRFDVGYGSASTGAFFAGADFGGDSVSAGSEVSNGD